MGNKWYYESLLDYLKGLADAERDLPPAHTKDSDYMVGYNRTKSSSEEDSDSD